MKVLLFLLLSLNLSGQKCFIGMSRDKVEDYWSTRESAIYFNFHEDTINKTSQFVIFKDENPPFFVAGFKKDKCREHSQKITYKETSIMEARIQKMGYYYDKKTDCWYNNAKTVKWTIEPAGDYFFLTCVKLK